jgi:hypothetical protein
LAAAGFGVEAADWLLAWQAMQGQQLVLLLIGGWWIVMT